jgi:hypothetical protein
MRPLVKLPTSPGQSRPDYLQKDGAEYLAEHLRATLRSRWPGASVRVWTELFKARNGQDLFAIHSDLVAGLPQHQNERLESVLGA